MQRTVYSTKFTYVENEIHEDGSISSVIKTHIVHETDDKKALKKAVKEIGYFAPIKTEKVSALYVLDDDIFFKYATVKKDNADESNETDTAESNETDTAESEE